MTDFIPDRHAKQIGIQELVGDDDGQYGKKNRVINVQWKTQGLNTFFLRIARLDRPFIR